MKPCLSILASAALLLSMPGCDTLVTGMTASARDWPFVQSVGGLALGTPQRDTSGHVLLPIRCDVSGTVAITVRPTAINSALACEPPVVRTKADTIYLTLRTTLATRRHPTSVCPPADLGKLAAGSYRVIYRDPGGQQHLLGSIVIPKL